MFLLVISLRKVEWTHWRVSSFSEFPVRHMSIDNEYRELYNSAVNHGFIIIRKFEQLCIKPILCKFKT